MKLELSPDFQSVTISTSQGSLNLSASEFRQILSETGNLVECGFHLPPVQAEPVPDRMLEGSGRLTLPANATNADPTIAGAGLVVHTYMFGHCVIPLTPADCKDWGGWLLGKHPVLAAPAGEILN